MKKYGLKAAPFSIYNDNDPLSFVTKVFRSHFLRDRFNILNKYSPFNVSEQADIIPTPYSVPFTLTELMDARAIELLGSNNVVMVAWSGGIDSTAVLVSLLRNCPENERYRIKVAFTEASINENPNFYKMLTTLGVQMLKDEYITDTLREEECDVITSGWCSDQLFGSDVHLKNLDLYNKPWIDALDWHIHNSTGKHIGSKSKDILVEVYSDYANKLGVNLEQWCEFAWMFNFGVKWTGIQAFKQYTLAGSDNLNKLNTFFDTLPFQRFGLTQSFELASQNIYAKPSIYKLALKQYIFEFNKDYEYLKNKGKYASWAGDYSANPIKGILVLTDDGIKQYKFTSCNGCRSKLLTQVRNYYLKEGR